MNLLSIKEDLVKLCIDLQDGMPEDLNERIIELRRQMIHSPHWIDKNEHFRLKAVECLWNANLPNKKHEEVRWQVNKADGWLDEAIRLDIEERRKGIPKPLAAVSLVEDPTEDWIEASIEPSPEGFTSNQDVYEAYKSWMEDNATESEVISSIAFGKKLGGLGYESTSKKIAGKAVRGWKLKLR